MRLRPRFPVLQAMIATGWTFMVGLKIWAIIHRGWTSDDGWWMALAVLWILQSGGQTTQSLLTTWEFGAEALLEHRAHGERQIPYSEIVSVNRTQRGMPSGPYFEVEYGKLGSALDPRSSLLMNPVQTEVFLKELREHAPQAVFSV